MKVIENRNKCFILSLCVISIGLIVMIINGVSGRGVFSYDVVFSGGTAMVIDIGQDFNNDDIMGIINETTGQNSPQVQKIIGTNQVSVKMTSVDQETRIKMIDAIQEKYGLDDAAILSVDDVSATVSSEMQATALIAIGVACLAMLVYVSIRFKDVKTGGSAILALLHDALVMLAAYAILRIPLNYSFIAAILTVMGYSINATIIIFDRIRENRQLMRRQTDYAELVNKSVTQTLRRSLFTTLTTLITISTLYILGVPAIREFALPIIIGIVAGTYSSICIAGSLWYVFTVGIKKAFRKEA